MWGPSEHRALGTCTAGWPVRQPSHLETLDQSRGPPASTTILALSAWPNPCSASRRVGIASLGFSLYKAGTVSHTCESPESGQALARVSQAAIMSAVFNWLPHKRVPACPVSLIPWTFPVLYLHYIYMYIFSSLPVVGRCFGAEFLGSVSAWKRDTQSMSLFQAITCSFLPPCFLFLTLSFVHFIHPCSHAVMQSCAHTSCLSST